MKFTKLSGDFTPIHQGIFYDVDTENNTPSEVVVEIVNADTEKVVASQLLRGISAAKVNIAPYLPRFTERKPHRPSNTTFVEAPTATFYLRANGVISESIKTSVNLCDAPLFTTITTLPTLRRISYGEYDELLVRVPQNGVVAANITANNGESLSIERVASTGIIALSISTKDFGNNIDLLSVELILNGERFNRIDYLVAQPQKSSVRLAWVSENGSIERYTFSRTETRCMVKKLYFNTDSCRTTASATTRHNWLLTSRYEPHAAIEALSHIISSPKVWIEEESLREIEVCTSQINYNLFNEPDIVELEVCELRREVAL